MFALHRAIVAAIILMTGAANASPLTCSGALWNIRKDEGGETWIEIGHGLYQCSIKGVASDAGKKILSVCNLGKRCTVTVNIAPRTTQELADQDGVVVTAKDKVLSVRPGAADDSGYKGSMR
jgi:hypothetical protein